MHSCGVVGWFKVVVVLASTTLMLVVGGCGGPGAARPTPSPSPSAAPIEPTVQPLRPLVAVNPGQPITEAQVLAVVDGVLVQGIFLSAPTLYAVSKSYRGGEPTCKSVPLTPPLAARLLI